MCVWKEKQIHSFKSRGPFRRVFFHPEREANKKEQKLFPFGNIDTYIFTKHLIVVVAVVLFYIHGKNLRSCRDGQLT